MVPGVENAMILAEQLIAGVFADGAELVVDVGDGSPHVGGGDDGVLIQSKFLIG